MGNHRVVKTFAPASIEHQWLSLFAALNRPSSARKEAAMAVIPDDPDSLRARLERTNQFASLARQAVTQARQAARRATWEAADRVPPPALSPIGWS